MKRPPEHILCISSSSGPPSRCRWAPWLELATQTTGRHWEGRSVSWKEPRSVRASQSRALTPTLDQWPLGLYGREEINGILFKPLLLKVSLPAAEPNPN